MSIFTTCLLIALALGSVCALVCWCCVAIGKRFDQSIDEASLAGALEGDLRPYVAKLNSGEAA